MIEIDIHEGNPNVRVALGYFESFFKRHHHKKNVALKIICGYGSTSGNCKIKNALLRELEDLKNKKEIKDYILGNELDIFNKKYQSLINKELIPESEKKIMNPGCVFIFL